MNGWKLTEGGEILQVTPEYTGCSTDKGTFNKVQFMRNARLYEIKIIELDLSKAAKARHEIFSTSKIGNITSMNAGATLSTLRLQGIYRSRRDASFHGHVKGVL